MAYRVGFNCNGSILTCFPSKKVALVVMALETQNMKRPETKSEVISEMERGRMSLFQ